MSEEHLEDERDDMTGIDLEQIRFKIKFFFDYFLHLLLACMI